MPKNIATGSALVSVDSGASFSLAVSYTGAMTREEREDELKALTLYEKGREQLLDDFLAAYKYGAGGVLPPHETAFELIQAILAKEFPAA